MPSTVVRLFTCLLLCCALAGPALASGGGSSKESGPPSTLTALEPFLVNLSDEGGKRYLKITIAVDGKNEKNKKALEERLPIVKDSILLLLSSKTVKEVATMEGKLKLRDEVRRNIARILGAPENQVIIYFTDFFIQ